jgi:ABC-2 type transport system permease protein
MFRHIFTTRLKCLMRDKQLVFWTLVFPLALATFFNMAFSNLNAQENFNPINLAVVDNEAYRQDEGFREVLTGMSEGEDRLFNLTTATREEAGRLLEDGDITGFVTVGSPPELTVRGSGINQNIIKIFLDSYSQTTSSVHAISSQDPSSVPALMEEVGNRMEYTKEVSATGANPNNVLNYFYSLLAMACMYGGFFGNREIMDIQADLNPLAARVNVSPVHKLKAFIYSISASLLIHFVSLLVLLAYLYFILRIDFGERTGFVLLTTFIGSIVGVSFGAFISAVVRKDENTKISILIGVSMLGSFLAGMMFADIKYILNQRVPIIAYINPIALITDAFYALYYYDGYDRYILNMSILTAFIAVFWVGTYLILRRRKYASL